MNHNTKKINKQWYIIVMLQYFFFWWWRNVSPITYIKLHESLWIRSRLFNNKPLCVDDGPNPVYPAHNKVSGSDDVTPHCGLQWGPGEDVPDTVWQRGHNWGGLGPVHRPQKRSLPQNTGRSYCPCQCTNNMS